MTEVNSLKKIQSSLQVFYQKINNIHWNIKGLEFFEIHEETDKLKEEILEFVDQIAEKIVMKDQDALGSYKEILEYSFIKEIESRQFNYKESLEILIEDLIKILEFSENIEWSARVQPIFDEVLLSFDKWLWQFKAMNKNN
ncbi:Dps family protein [Mesomycoplasma molare]|uniref:DNA starvation/stationary phase protection protein n=1 Tax=Mesomycoplasma molare TaxID=171288 RepID=A0ABY5TV22_9BACT|nr:DNA starvation/stationary phase protection protein [Mesomycoplasma molare]UWD34513.1 DNA starvation/stationary phase protection protein [Mesomycoplasma molare]